VIRDESRCQWEEVPSAVYTNEAELQELLAASPSLVPLPDVRGGQAELLVAVKEFGLPGSGAADIVAFSERGDIAVVECKLEANQQAKREVVGQILEYGAYLWNTSYEELDRRVKSATGRSLAELMHQEVGEKEWSEEDFRASVTDSLAKGRFLLIVAVDAINDELQRIIRYVNAVGEAAFSLHALELRRFKKDKADILVPHLYGQGEGPSPPGAHPWTAERFMARVRERLTVEECSIAEDLLEWSQAHAEVVSWGIGAQEGSFSYYINTQRTARSVFVLYTNGNLWLCLGWPEDVDEITRKAFHKRITAIPGFESLPEDLKGKWPTYRISDLFLANPNALAAFKEAVDSLQKSVK